MQRKKDAKNISKEISKNWILNLEFQKLATASGSFVVQDPTCTSFWYRLDFNNERKPGTVRIRLVSQDQGRMLPCGKIAYDHVAKSN